MVAVVGTHSVVIKNFLFELCKLNFIDVSCKVFDDTKSEKLKYMRVAILLPVELHHVDTKKIEVQHEASYSNGFEKPSRAAGFE